MQINIARRSKMLIDSIPPFLFSVWNNENNIELLFFAAVMEASPKGESCKS